jgi:hypothetical protein
MKLEDIKIGERIWSWLANNPERNNGSRIHKRKIE